MNGTEHLDAFVIEEFISEAEQAHLRTLACTYKRRGILEANPSGPRRFRRKVYGTEYCDEAMDRVAARLVERLHLDGCSVDPYLGWIISYIEPGGFIKPHIDRHAHYQTTTDRHLRCNVLVQGDDESAFPIISSRPITVMPRSMWAFFASEHAHGTAPVRGPLPRIVYQFGFVVPAGYEFA